MKLCSQKQTCTLKLQNKHISINTIQVRKEFSHTQIHIWIHKHCHPFIKKKIPVASCDMNKLMMFNTLIAFLQQDECWTNNFKTWFKLQLL